ncbi:Mrp/NBP35 family ATP-binding protein [Pigmentibacter sp. JX0631]|uniref:Mrp/NBP35 family ATP-binding protein n=1 Tax=Pigmentibacter sp. JX0631 TaxID=2976982 RepID=UPI0024685335|nr:Mrp/NBP35 family ATP-binding protein [Pigmentibacter sp. JX0631]WGL60919.1 Mrp/NBP35 family ATP-binding protein [Pigmentibacter sp. JX0631]
MENTQNLITFHSVKELSSRVTKEIYDLLGSFPWQERIISVEKKDSKTLIRFYSDGLNLASKALIEQFLKEQLSSFQEEFAVYFERKEKTTASPNSAPKSASQEKPQVEDSAKKTSSGKKPIAGVKRIIAVASGKGGVGKSTVSVNLAIALHNQGYKVGILDADIYGPSVPTMLNLHQDPLVNEHNKIIPPEAHGLKVMSFGFFAPEETAVIWRGPMIMKALQQFFWDVDWGSLDFLIIDLPPGTGDAQLTLVQSIPITGSVIVTTPQNVALLDAVKGIAMFRKTEVPILGVVENMSTFTCPACGSESHIFGTGGAERVANKFEVELLGHVPLLPEVRAAGDEGEPLTTQPNHPIRIRFAEIAEKVVKNAIQMENK